MWELNNHFEHEETSIARSHGVPYHVESFDIHASISESTKDSSETPAPVDSRPWLIGRRYGSGAEAGLTHVFLEAAEMLGQRPERAHRVLIEQDVAEDFAEAGGEVEVARAHRNQGFSFGSNFGSGCGETLAL